MRSGLLCLLILAGCDPGADPLEDPGFGQVPFWPDADGDGWGDPDGTYVCSVERPASHAPNFQDCDDAQPSWTGRVGAVCPDGIVTESGTWYDPDAESQPVEDVRVLQLGPTETLFTFGEAPLARYTDASGNCELWGRQLPPEAQLGRVGQGSTGLTDALLETLDEDGDGVADTGWAGFLDIRWDGSAFVWGTGDPVTEFPFCEGIDPGDGPGLFFPNLLTVPPEEGPDVRLALVVQPWNDAPFCLGTPADALAPGTEVGADGYRYTAGHMVCDRPTPDPLDMPLDAAFFCP